jgi:flagellar biosynthesis/type III secretory pathway protein FliH
MENKNLSAMEELLAQLKEERINIPAPKEWMHCLRSIEIVIEKHYLDLEKKQIMHAFTEGYKEGFDEGFEMGFEEEQFTIHKNNDKQNSINN